MGICRICKQETPDDKLANGVCSECIQRRAHEIKKLQEEALDAAEIELNHDNNRGVPLDDDILLNAYDKTMKMEPEQFVEQTMLRKVFILALMKMAGLEATKGNEQIVDDIQWMIDNQLKLFWGKSIRFTTADKLQKDDIVLANKGKAYIVEL